MSKLNNTDFQSIQEILSAMDFKKDFAPVDGEALFEGWKQCVGEKVSGLSKPLNLSQDGVLTISCANSLVANELYMERHNLLQIVRENFKNLGIEIKVLKIDKKIS